MAHHLNKISSLLVDPLKYGIVDTLNNQKEGKNLIPSYFGQTTDAYKKSCHLF